MNRLIAIIITIFLLTPSTGKVQGPVPIEDQIIELLTKQKDILTEIEPGLERFQRSRIVVIRKAVDVVIADIVNNRSRGQSPVTFQTIRLIQYLIVQYRFSHVFLGWEEPPSPLSIQTPANLQALLDLQVYYQETQHLFGIDDTPYSKITAHYFRLMEKQIREIERLPIDIRIQAALRNLLPAIAHTIAIAEQGDRPRAFVAADKVIPQLRNLYADFRQISSASAGFAVVFELVGLVETYAEFAQYNQPDRSTSEECK